MTGIIQNFIEHIITDSYIPRGRNNLETELKRLYHDALKLNVDLHYFILFVEYLWIRIPYTSDSSLSIFDWYMTLCGHLYAVLLLFASYKYFTDRHSAYEWYFVISHIHCFVAAGILFDYGFFYAKGYCFGDYRIFTSFKNGAYYLYVLWNWRKLDVFFEYILTVYEIWLAMVDYGKFLDTDFSFTFMPRGG